ncbi:hypothetical protein M0805_003036 [Coniferiporia weirii]|nr:hypothetical protein M0805_003036 [Coniferiporia weirii]
MGPLLAGIRDRSSRFFHQFGIHCATHQIRLILISGLVITSLFYPALGIYTNPNSELLTTSTHILGHIDLRSLSFFEDDLDSAWSGHDALRTVDDTVARARCGMEKTIRIERVLLTSDGFDSDAGVISHEMLRSALELETALTDHLLLNKFKCLSSPSRQCITLSPLEFWSHDQHALQADHDLLQTINRNQNISAAGLSLRASMVFAGRESAEPHESSINFAAYLALTYFFHEDDCNGSIGHNEWLKALDSIISPLGDISVKAEEPVLLALEYDPDRRSSQHVSLMTLTLYLSYVIFFIYFSGSMRRMDTVHSRVGLCFTGLVEILVSTITSLSVCALFGLRITLVPWGIFPIVIVFVGAENMFRLIDDVVNTPISLPVKERIGLGLSRAGTSNTLKVVSYNAILGVIAFFAQGAIRQFCAFAIVVLVAHWFLIHTFFVAVLSIDIQRLELDDLLRQNPSLTSLRRTETVGVKQSARMGTLSRIVGRVQKITKGRVAKNVSLLLMLVITATLYYSTLPSASTRINDGGRTPASRSSIMRPKVNKTSLDKHSDARQVWRVLSPHDDPRIHIRIEAPAIVTLDHQLGDMKTERRLHRPRWSVRTLRPLWWISKVVVLPIGATLGCLYALLLYLLKDADRLESHKGQTDDDLETGSSPVEGQPLFKTFPRAFASDVNLLASSRDGSVLASVSSDGEFFFWLASSLNYIKVDTADLILRGTQGSSAQCALTVVAIDDRGEYCAVGAGSGTIAVWSIQENSVHPVAHYFSEECASPVIELEFDASETYPWDTVPKDGKARIQDQPKSIPCVHAVYDNGRAVRWINGVAVHLQPLSAGELVRTSLIRLPDVTHPIVCFFFNNGALEIVDNHQGSSIGGPVFVQAGTPDDLVVSVHACVVGIEDTSHLLVAAARHSGIITLWDVTTGDCMFTFDDAYGSVNNVRLLPISVKACSQCGEVPLCGFALAYSIGHVVLVERGTLPRRCSCPLSQPLMSKVNTLKESSVGRRSRSGSFVSSSGMEATPHPRSRLPSVSSDKSPDINPFPVSAHGVHSRRGSERDGRRNSDRFDRLGFVSFDDGGTFDSDEQQRLVVPDVPRPTCSAFEPSVTCLWRNFRLVRVKEATCERGGWDVMGSKVVGLRRKPRRRHCHEEELNRWSESRLSESALSSSVLDRWEVWIVDPAKLDGMIQASSLSAFEFQPIDSGGENSRSVGGATRRLIPRLSFTRLSPLVIRNSTCLAGFGNTVGMVHLES